VLYLQHGAGESERAWTWQGRANVILDNLIADGKARPMVVVMENGYAPAPGVEEPGRQENRFADLVIRELIPRIDSQFRTLADRENRAIAGLSMGAGQALRIGLGNLEKFAHVGAFSGGGRNFDPETSFGGALRDAEQANRRLDLLWIGCGRQESQWAGATAMHAALEQRGVEHVWFECDGTHEWHVWRRSLHDFAPRLFRG
jgi:enterochelin esterase family protein